jgi:hypothetical protein
MLNTVLGITIVASILAYFGYWRLNVQRRRKYAWNLLETYLEPKNRGAELRYQLCLDQTRAITREEHLVSAHSANDLWSMYVNAGIMLDTADFVAQSCTGVDQGLLETLRSDATQVRAYALIALSKYAYDQVNDATMASASRAGIYYTDLLNRTTQLLDGNTPQLAFGSVAQM